MKAVAVVFWGIRINVKWMYVYIYIIIYMYDKWICVDILSLYCTYAVDPVL